MERAANGCSLIYLTSILLYSTIYYLLTLYIVDIIEPFSTDNNKVMKHGSITARQKKKIQSIRPGIHFQALAPH